MNDGYNIYNALTTTTSSYLLIELSSIQQEVV